jgi:hypothetical protein
LAQGLGKLRLTIETRPKPLGYICALGVKDVSACAMKKIALHSVALNHASGARVSLKDGHIMLSAQNASDT